jgi:dihydroxyacetone kinase-like protein
MKKFLNAVEDFLAESLAGFAAAHGELVVLHTDPLFIRRRNLRAGKVALISGGGSGHEPLHTGFIGHGMLDAACPGQVFTSPTPDQMVAAAEAVDTGSGVLFVVKNYSGDVMNFEMAAEISGRRNATVLVNDDVAVDDSSFTTGRRGVAGTVIVEKVVGSLAESGGDLEACKIFGDRVTKRTASMGVALTSCTVPQAGRPTLTLGEDELEMGVGIHGEAGRRRSRLMPADSIAAELLDAILANLQPRKGSDVLLLVNGLGGTPLAELYVLCNAAHRRLSGNGLQVQRTLVGNFTTSLEMAGASLTVCLLDEEILRHWDSPVNTPALRWSV